MDVYSKIAESIKSIARTGGLRQPVLFSAKVEKVEGETCTVTIDGLTVTGVRLRAVVNNSKEQLFIQPRVGSYVLAIDLGELRQLAVIAYSEIDKIHIKISNTTVDIDNNGVVFNSGELKGLVKLQELKDNLDSLKQYVEAIHSALPSAFNAIGASTAANGALGATSYNGSMAGKAVQLKDMENNRIKQ